MRQRRILQVCAVDFTAYHLLRPLLTACRDADWDVEFTCADGPGAAALRQEGFRYRPIAISRRPSPPRNMLATLALARSLAANPVDIVHTHTPAGGVVGRLAAIAARTPRIVHTFHGLPFEGQTLGPMSRAFLQVEKFVARRTDHFFSQAAGDAALAARLGIARTRDTTVIGNGVDLRRFAPNSGMRESARSEFGLPDDAIVVTVVARLVREKGILDLADAAFELRDLPRIHFLIVGEALPSDRTGVSKDLNEHAVVDALGPRWRRLNARSDVERILNASDIFVLPSYREGLPRSIIEAMASAVPVIATDIPACRELVEPGETGLLVALRAPDLLARAIRDLADDAPRRRAMGRRAREIAEARHDEQRILETELRVLTGLIDAR